MKKLVAFVVILSLGVFCAVGCSKPAAAPKKDGGKKVEAPKDVKADAKADEKAPAAKADEKKADEKAPAAK